MPRNFVDKSLWNTQLAVNNVNVPIVGQVNGIFAGIGGLPGTPVYGSQGDTGKIICLSDAEAAAFSFLTNGTLFGGLYQLVQLDTAATSANALVGMAAFLLDTAAGGAENSGSQGYVVTDQAHAIATTHCVGVFLNTITPGNFGFIQVAGKATVQYTAAVTSASQSSSVTSTGATAGTFDAIVAALTGITEPSVIGTRIQVPANAGLKTIHMQGMRIRF
jgi:hypothetical protein